MSKLSAIVVVMLLAAGANAALVTVDSPVIAIDPDIQFVTNWFGTGANMMIVDVVLSSQGVWAGPGGWGMPNYVVGDLGGTVTAANLYLYNNAFGFDIGLKVLTGDGMANHPSFDLNGSNIWNQVTSGDWEMYINFDDAAAHYAMRLFGTGTKGLPTYKTGTATSTSGFVVDLDDGLTVLTEAMLDERKIVTPAGWEGMDVATGDVVARFYVLWNGLPVEDVGGLVLHVQAGGQGDYAGFRMNPPGAGPSDNGNRYVTVLNNDYEYMVPEPATMGLLGLGLIGLVIRRKK